MARSLIVLHQNHDDFFKQREGNKSGYIRNLINLDVEYREWLDKNGR